MKGSVSHELEVGLTAGEVWDVFGTIRLAELIPELAPHVVAKTELLEGDGGVGSVVLVTFPSGSQGPKYHKEKFVLIDDIKRVKDTEVLEGGYLELGFSSYLIRFEIVEREGECCTIRSVVEYEIADEQAEKASLVTTAPFEALGDAVAKYLMEKRAN